jgi:hypothetical protein
MLIMLIKKIPQWCRSANKAQNLLDTHVNTNHSKNLAVVAISRFSTAMIQPATRLSGKREKATQEGGPCSRAYGGKWGMVGVRAGEQESLE